MNRKLMVLAGVAALVSSGASAGGRLVDYCSANASGETGGAFTEAIVWDQGSANIDGTNVFSIASAQRVETEGRLIQLEGRMTYSRLANDDELAAIDVTGAKGAMVGCQNALGVATWRGLALGGWVALKGATPATGVGYIVRQEFDYTAPSPVVRYSVATAAEGNFTVLANSEGETWLPMANAVSKTAVEVAFCGFGAFSGLLGQYVDTSTVQLGDGRKFETLAEALIASGGSGTITLFEDVEFAPSGCAGTWTIDGGAAPYALTLTAPQEGFSATYAAPTLTVTELSPPSATVAVTFSKGISQRQTIATVSVADVTGDIAGVRVEAFGQDGKKIRETVLEYTEEGDYAVNLGWLKFGGGYGVRATLLGGVTGTRSVVGGSAEGFYVCGTGSEWFRAEPGNETGGAWEIPPVAEGGEYVIAGGHEAFVINAETAPKALEVTEWTANLTVATAEEMAGVTGQGAFTLFEDQGGNLMWMGLINGEWQQLFTDIPPAEGDFVIRAEADYSGAEPRIAYALVEEGRIHRFSTADGRVWCAFDDAGAGRLNAVATAGAGRLASVVGSEYKPFKPRFGMGIVVR